MSDEIDILAGAPRPPWRDDAACRGMDPALFFPERGTPTADAKAVCRTCPVRFECLFDAVEARERFGIWGGYSERERRVMRRQVSRGADLDAVVAEALGAERERRAETGEAEEAA